VALRVGRIALATVAAGPGRALVERQEDRLGPREPRGHEDQVRVDGEVGQRPPGEDAIAGIPLLRVAVLRLRVPDGLAGEVVLQLRGRDGNAVDGEHQIQGLVRSALAVVQLPVHQQPILPVVLDQLRREPVRGPEERQLDALPGVLHPPAQHVDDAVRIDLVGDPLGDLRDDGAAVPDFEVRPRLRLCLLDELHQLDGIEA
jgi:hypothetical protein